MAQANLPVLPQISAALAAPPAKPRSPADSPNDGAAFSKELDKHLRPAEPPKPEAAAKSAESPAEPPPQAAAGLRNAASRGRSDTDPPPAKTVTAATAESEAATLAAVTEAAAAALAALGVVSDRTVDADPLAPADLLPPADPKHAADAAAADPLLASLAGLPAALAALLAGGGAAANGAGTAAEGAAAPGAATPPPSAAPATGAEALASTLARMLADTSAARAPAAAVVAPDGRPNPAVTADAATLPEGTTSPLTAEQPGAFAAALDEATGRGDKPAVLPATETATGPASRASETAQLAANPTAGDAARVEPNPAAAMAWAAAPGRAHTEDGGPRLVVAQPPEHPGWAESVGSKVTWLVGQGESSAELVLTPPHLGRVEVSLSVTGDQTTAQFIAATPAAREVLEQALPRLREVLAEAGIQLAQSEVSTSGRQDGGGEGSQHGARRHEGKGAPGGELENTARPWLRRGEGLVDTFA